jgi:hypothetical protein
VGTYKPDGTSYTDDTLTLTVTAGTHTIAFQGVDSGGGDNTAFIDDLVITAVPVVVANPGFETPVVGNGKYAYDPAGATWSFSGLAGISGNASPFTVDNPDAPEGVQVAFVQETGSISQTINSWPSSFYQLTFSAAQRANYIHGGEDFEFMVDGTVIAIFKPTTDTFLEYSIVFDVAAGNHTITFKGLDTTGGDNTALIDNVSITPV